MTPEPIDLRTVAGKRYTIEYKNALDGSSWTPITPAIDGDGAIHTVTQNSVVTTRFYQLRIE